MIIKRQGGFVLSLEMLIFSVILVLGLIVGWVSVRDSVNAELVDTANAIESSITLYYFSDPNRGAGYSFTEEVLQFTNAGNSSLQNENATNGSGDAAGSGTIQ